VGTTPSDASTSSALPLQSIKEQPFIEIDKYFENFYQDPALKTFTSKFWNLPQKYVMAEHAKVNK
jgi:hypothetical protein